MDKKILRDLSYGVYVVSTWDKGRATGCVANSAMQVASAPAVIAVSICHDNYTNSCIKDTGKFALSILSEQSDPKLIGHFGFQSGKDVDKFADIDFSIKGFMPVLDDGCGYMVCDVTNMVETETHTVFFGKVTEGEKRSSFEPMTYAYYHNVIKGSSPKNAPTYQEEAPAVEAGGSNVCGICGYVYDGDVPFDELPDDYVCPICGQPKSAFKKA